MADSKQTTSPSFMLHSASSHPNRRAVIDVGTNSVKLLVADVVGSHVTPLTEESKQTRLGAGFYETHRLQPEAIAKTAAVVAKFSALAKQMDAATIRVIATSAARDALNANELLAAIQQSSALTMEIISGEQEADWVFQGVTSDPNLAPLPLLILDLGGGSTEFILVDNSIQQFRSSYRLGTVRLLEQLQPPDPPSSEELARCRDWLRKFLEKEIAPALEPAFRLCRQPVQLVGTGGTATILARMEAQMEYFDRERIEATRLSFNQLRMRVESLWQMPLAKRQTIVGLPPKRADVILTGVAIYEAVMERFGFAELRVSTRGLRYAALMSA
jgi:exopolyphosphatase/guanosine-5'-triphosphate,3'-diphosphate pyrophosphatase